MAVKDGSVCPKCGTAYYSSGDLCYACSQMETSEKPRLRKLAKLTVVILLGVTLVLLGILSLNYVAHPDAGRGDPRDISLASAIFAAGVGVVTYSILARPVPMWRIRQGERPQSRWASFFMSLSVTHLAYLSSNQIVSSILDIDGIGVFWLVGLLGLAIFLMLVGFVILSRWPPSLFAAGELGPPRPIRISISIVVILIGVSLIGCSMVLMPLLPTEVAFWLLISGFILIFSAVPTLAGPLPRPWLHTGFDRDQ